MNNKAEFEQQQLEWASQVVHTDDAEPWELRRIGGLDVHWIDDLKGVMLHLCVSWTIAERTAILVHAAPHLMRAHATVCMPQEPAKLLHGVSIDGPMISKASQSYFTLARMLAALQ